MRADGWNRLPLIRMTNINLVPRPGMSLADIVADTDDGLYLESNRSWSIDDRRLNFQFATEVAREIKGGKLGQLCQNATYTGITPSSGAPATPSPTRSAGCSWAPPTAARASPARSCTWATAAAAPASATSRWGSASGERRRRPRRWRQRRRVPSPCPRRRRHAGRGARHPQATRRSPVSPTARSTRTWPRATRWSTCASWMAGAWAWPRPTASTTRPCAGSPIARRPSRGCSPSRSDFRSLPGARATAPSSRAPARRPRREAAGGARGGARAAVIAAAEAVGVAGLRLVHDRGEGVGVANRRGRRASRSAPPRAHHGDDGPRRRGRLCRVGGRGPDRASTPRPSGARRPRRARDSRGAVAIEPGDYPVVLEQLRRGGPRWRCSATWASRRWPCRRSAPSTSRDGSSARSS